MMKYIVKLTLKRGSQSGSFLVEVEAPNKFLAEDIAMKQYQCFLASDVLIEAEVVN